jgi:hypothetical protein
VGDEDTISAAFHASSPAFCRRLWHSDLITS